MKLIQTKKVIILAGGLGTRLRSVLPGVPKPMAPIHGVPFLEVLLMLCKNQFITEVIISVGYKSEHIINYFGSEYLGMRIRYALEEKLLGTGGAILKSSDCINDNDSFFVLNGDTFFNIDLSNFFSFSKKLGADVSLALFKSDDTRYGDVYLDGKNHLKTMMDKDYFLKEKNLSKAKNGGIYFFSGRSILKDFPRNVNLNFENDILQKLELKKILITGKIYTDDFIDIGIPSDYGRSSGMDSIIKIIEKIKELRC